MSEVGERVEMVERNKGNLTLRYYPVSLKCPWKKADKKENLVYEHFVFFD